MGVLRVAIFTLLLTLPCLCQESPLRAPGRVVAQTQFLAEADFGEDLPAGSTAHLLVLGDEHCITFQQYCKEQADKGFQVPFGKWLESKPELGEVLKDLALDSSPLPRP